ncbi:PAS domain S-box-containing protein/diguanylate cyclase (GGDEF) domain-containing protein [Blastococcus aurantiacus]|uniref:PAS domain S-box-containing protein/diguanylate cyclase (GGDEF) domain-containing protein n=1 Tax=Blastococcus aurantiacus TaxID=1550231 RepID=A0A1G7KKI8_9ACTN|nr:bifunctional diguanylate cyclase/phosphodiesterase [Blastococcus aurantiacus]SDF37621.1 PAS domain S-box-containing protein/diguanylate cyclase (GGDEF) domain-containing protein [Blastococcus aurantiacus]
MTVPPGAQWSRRPVLLALAGSALALVVQQLAVPGWNGWSGPAVLAVATLGVAAVVGRHCARLDASAASWRAFAVIAVLLGLGHLVRAVTVVGVNPVTAGPSDLILAATGPVAVLLCVRLMGSTVGRIRVQVALDAVVALVALGVLLQMLVPLTADPAGGPVDPLLTVFYPAVAAVLCALGLVTVGAVSAPRRTAAAWLLLGFASLAATMGAGALAVAHPSPLLDAVATTAYLGMLATATLALAADPGPRAPVDDHGAAVPLSGVVVSYCLSFVVLLLLLGCLAAGRPLVALEAATVAVLMVLTFVRTLVWAADGARLTRHVLRTEAYFRTLVHDTADVTIVLDGQGQVTWTAVAAPEMSAWLPRDLEGRALRDLVHPDDRHELHRAVDRGAERPGTSADRRNPVIRLRGRNGSWRAFESVRTASSAGLPAGDATGAVRGDGLVLHLRDVAGQRSAELELERLAYTDYLTGLPNRARLMAALTDARARAVQGEPASFLLLDLDGFKLVNDVAGHEAGDDLLVQVAARMRAAVRDGDLVARLGGDEFAVLVPGGLEEAVALAERIVADLRTVRPAAEAGGRAAGVVFDVSGSIGVTELDPADEVSDTIRQADVALRAAKSEGKCCVRTAARAIDSAMGRRARLARDLPSALELEQFRMVYQPVVGAEERRILGIESLVRWDHPQLGTVPPDEFISLAEEEGLIVPLQRWVLRRATRDAAAVLAAGWDVMTSVNVSVRHLQAGCLAPDVASALAEAGLPPHKLILEITESVMLDAEDRLQSDLATLEAMGCVLSVDDFGRGYSSLAYLARLPVTILKLDREFLADIESDERGATLVAGVIDLGRRLGMDVVAEGVENLGQLRMLRDMGCRYLQGWLFGRPVDATELSGVLAGFDPGMLDDAPGAELDTGVHTVGRAG